MILIENLLKSILRVLVLHHVDLIKDNSSFSWIKVLGTSPSVVTNIDASLQMTIESGCACGLQSLSQPPLFIGPGTYA